MSKGYKEEGVIESVKIQDYRDDGDRPNTVWIFIDYVSGGRQGFGGLCLPTEKDINSFLLSVMTAFSVTDAKKLVGKRCYALKAFDTWNEDVVGLMSFDTGDKMTVNSWRKSAGYPVKLIIDEKRESMRRSIENWRNRIWEEEKRLRELDQHYREWD